jgi:hypothetical protein
LFSQTLTHNPQPLHFSLFISGEDIIKVLQLVVT